MLSCLGFGYGRSRGKVRRCAKKSNIAISLGRRRRIIRCCAWRDNDCWAALHPGCCPGQRLNKGCCSSCATFAITPIRFVKHASCRRWLRNSRRKKPLLTSEQNKLRFEPARGNQRKFGERISVWKE